MNDLAKKIEALLFVSGEGLSYEALSKQLRVSEAVIRQATEILKQHLAEEHFLALLDHEGKISLVSSSSVSSLVEEFAKEEFASALTRAALETLAIIAYKGPVRRADIDYIRGVNSSFMIRNLLMRGLVERTRDPKDARSYAYRISPEFLKYLGMASITDLPEYGSFAQKLEEFIEHSDAAANNEPT